MKECGRKIIEVPRGRTYYYDGKFLVQTLKLHTSEERYVTLKMIGYDGRLFTRYESLYCNDGIEITFLSADMEFWGEIDRCHMVRKTPVELDPNLIENMTIFGQEWGSQTSRGKKSFNEMK